MKKYLIKSMFIAGFTLGSIGANASDVGVNPVVVGGGMLPAGTSKGLIAKNPCDDPAIAPIASSGIKTEVSGLTIYCLPKSPAAAKIGVKTIVPLSADIGSVAIVTTPEDDTVVVYRNSDNGVSAVNIDSGHLLEYGTDFGVGDVAGDFGAGCSDCIQVFRD